MSATSESAAILAKSVRRFLKDYQCGADVRSSVMGMRFCLTQYDSFIAREFQTIEFSKRNIRDTTRPNP